MVDPLQELRDVATAALAPVEGELLLPGLREPVEVLRDAWGIPYVTASSQEDLWFAQGVVHASERLFQIDLTLRAASGRLSEWFSELTLPADRFARTVGFARIGAAEAERWSDASRAMMRRFVEGVHAWTRTMPSPPLEYGLLAIAPELPEDLGSWAAAFAYVAWGLSGNWGHELLRAHLAERLGAETADTLLPPVGPADGPRDEQGALDVPAGSLSGRLLDGLPRSNGQGSNAWAIAGAHTSSGAPLLANDPHLLAQQPAAWFEIHLSAPGYRARGVAFPFAPGIAIGTTAHHAWGLTNVSGDVQDLYVERLDASGTSAEFDGAWEPLRTHEETIGIRGGDPVTLQVRESRHGPLLEWSTVGVAGNEFAPLEETYALRWTAADSLVEPETLVGIVRATAFEEFRQSLRGLACPGQNVVYADVEGTIAYQCTGRFPIRRSGDGTVPVPGWTSQHEWEGWIPFERLPWAMDPKAGSVVTANNRNHDAAYPHLIGRDFHAPFRARRITDELAASSSWSVETAGRLQVDTVSLPARRILPRLLETTPKGEDARWALEALRAWDGDLRPDSVAAALYEVWVGTLAEALLHAEADRDTFDRYFAWREAFACEALPELLERTEPGGRARADVLEASLDAALDVLRERLGSNRDGWRWGALHRVRFAHPLARLPGLGALFVAAEHELGGDEQTVLQGGIDARLGFDALVVPSWRVVVDLGDLDRSMAVLTTGQSGNPASTHWNDQAPLWADGELRPCPFTRPAVEAAAKDSLRLLPG
jgi:penicillin amidase